MKIEIKDYFSENEIKEIISDELKSVVKKDAERILSNMSYEASFKIIDSMLDKKEMELIKEKTKNILKDPSSYSIFRKRDAWGKEDSEAYKELQKAVEENKHLIYDNVKQCFMNKNFEKFLDDDSNYFVECLLKMIKSGLKD